MSYYYKARLVPEGYRGVVFHYDETGNKEIVDYRSEPLGSKEDALDDAGEWADANGFDAELG